MEAAVAQRSDEEWRLWPLEAKRRLLLRLRERVYGSWRDRARPDQLPPKAWDNDQPNAPSTLFFGGGRGSGKTWCCAHIFREQIESDPLRETEGPGEWAVVAPTFGDARDKCIEGESGLLAAFGTTAGEVEAGISPTVAKWNRSIGELYLHDGTFIQIDGADDGAYRIQGLNLRGVWCDEVGLWKKWKTAWRESIGFALRKGHARRIASGTPKRNLPARQLIRELLDNPRVISRRLLTKDNWHNLSPTFREEVAAYVDTELGRQELEGMLLEEAEGALWKRDWIDHVPRSPEKGYRVKVIALDPADGKKDPADGKDEGDEQGLCFAGLGLDNDFYVIHSRGTHKTPLAWLRDAVLMAHEDGAVLVIEMNHSGEFLIGLLEQVMKELGVRVPYVRVWASKGKTVRAEPVAMLYEQGHNTGNPIIHHVGEQVELENQMAQWTGEPGEPSPGRLDALVWAMTYLMRFERNPKTMDERAIPYKEAQGPEMAVAYR